MKSKRKIMVLCGDGMGDLPAPALNGRTPLQAADIPAIRRIAAQGRRLLIKTVPDGLSPGSDVANMGLLGYDARENYTGRAAIEAAGSGVMLAPEDVAYRVNLVTVEKGNMVDYSAGEISTEEGIALIRSLAAAFQREGLALHDGISYRHLLTLRNGPTSLPLAPPHEITGRPVADYLPATTDAEPLLALIECSKQIFADHPVNQARRAKGLHPATQVWPWGCGKAMQLTAFESLHHRKGSVITAVNLIRGLATLAGLKNRDVEGATGWVDTHYAGKAAAALQAFAEGDDFVYVHVEAPDECGHKQNAPLKTSAIEDFSAKIVAPIWEALEKAGEPYRLIVCTDHRTPCSTGGHTSDPVPFAYMNGPVGEITDQEAAFDEYIPAGESIPLACNLMRELLRD